ncbi:MULTISPECIES: ketopantoate reductase family protein [unclassified Pseudoalteromonas]|uniref:ketopantoate reductase family protein n=1 Tax=unclassified Pseudoalteromonas TaxID=194690 RepID=UPI00301563CE
MPKLYIVGDGAIGLLLAKHLSQQFAVTLVTRKAHSERYYYHDAGHTQPLEVATCQQESIADNSIDLLLMPVKSYQAQEAFMQFLPKLSANANLIISHNGMLDWQSALAQLQGQQSAYFFSTAMAGYKTAHTVHHTGQGASWFGPLNDAATDNYQAVFSRLFSNLEHAEPCADIMTKLWQKLAVNIAINPLTALAQVNNGQLLQPQYSRQILALLNEVQVVAASSGVNLPLADILHLAYTVMAQTAANFSSMAQDVAKQRQTEIDAMCGFIVAKARQQGNSAPQNEALLQRVMKVSGELKGDTP